MSSSKALLTQNTHKLLRQYLLPSISATLFISLNYIVDTICVGQSLGETGVTALGIAQPVCGALFGLGALMGVGGSTLFSIHKGRGEVKTARSIYTACFAVVCAVSVLIQALGLIFLSDVTTFLGGVGAARQGVMEYLTYVLLFAPAFSLEMFLSAFFRNDNAPRLAMVATFIGSGLNIVLDILFVPVLGWGIPGASLATSVSIVVAVVFLLIGTRRPGSTLRFARLREGVRCLPHALRTGLPSLLAECATSVSLLAFNLMLLRISGETAVAVYSVISNLSIIILNALAGVSNAMQPIVSTNIGAGRFKRARRVMADALLYSAGIALAFLLVGELFPATLLGVFIEGDAPFLGLAVPALRIIFLSYLPASITVLLSSYFQSVDESAPAVILTVLRGIVFPVLVVIGAGLLAGVTGVWFSALGTEMLSLGAALLLLRRVQKRMRLRNYSQLKYITSHKSHETLEEILQQLGAEDLTSFNELIHYANSRDESSESIPSYVCVEDLTTDYEGGYQPAEDDEGMGLFLAIGGVLFTNLYEQNDSYMEDKLREADYPAAAPAMNVLAERCFRFDYDEASDKTTVVPYRRGIMAPDELSDGTLPEDMA